MGFRGGAEREMGLRQRDRCQVEPGKEGQQK